MMAATAQPSSSTGNGHSTWRVADSSPAVNSSESPGRKKPIMIPDSANTMANSPSVPTLLRIFLGSSPIEAMSAERIGTD